VRGRRPDRYRRRPRVGRIAAPTIGLWVVVLILAAVVLARAL
jgi:hypothetical protein